MAQIVKTWSVTEMQCYADAAGKDNVVSTIEWLLTGAGDAHSATIRGVLNIPFNSASEFTDFASLTQDHVVGWVQSTMGAVQVAAYEDNLGLQIESLANPPLVTPPLPWAPPAES